MVLGLRSKNKKANTIQVDYLVQVQEISPWPPSHSVKPSTSLVLQWENGDQSYGTLACVIAEGKLEFIDSFRLLITLTKEASRKGNDRESYAKNLLEFYLFEPKNQKSNKGQLLGSAVVNLADYGIIRDGITISAPLNLKKSSKGALQPIVYFIVQAFEKGDDDTSSSLSKEVSMEKGGSESVSEVTNEEEIASFTDDDADDGDVSSAVVSSRGSPSYSEKNGTASAISSTARPKENAVLPSLGIIAVPVNSAEDYPVLVEKASNHASIHKYRSSQESQELKHKSGSEEAKVSNLPADHFLNIDGNDLKANAQDIAVLATKTSYTVEEKLAGEVSRDDTRSQVPLRSNTIASNCHAVGVQGNTRRDKLKQLKSIQLQYAASEGYRPSSNGQSTERMKKREVTERTSGRAGMINDQGEREEKPKSSIESNVKSRSEGEMLIKNENSAVTKNENSAVKVPPVQKPKRIEVVSKNSKKVGANGSPNGREVNKVEMLEEELMETAALEIGLYSVVAEHGSSANKVHAPARRLSRFYLHACKVRNQGKRANAARAIISGLILVSKACGNDVPRLTFWLSNSIVLRAIVSQAVEKLNLAPRTSPSKEAKANNVLDEWENPRTFITALEKVEAWIFSRIVESVWWQTLTPHMQSTAVKGAGSKKAHARKHGLGNQEQGNFAIDLWQKAFRDACERLCPIRAGGHECGCLPVLARLVMEQLVARLDVAMFNAVLRESADEMPTDPVSDPISDPKVLPIPAGKSSFGAGAQLKNAVGSWSRWLTDLFGIDEDDEVKDSETPFKIFHLLNALSDLMMLPFEMLGDQSTRKEVCPTFGGPLIKQVLSNFIPDEFNPDPMPDSILNALDSEDPGESGDESLMSFPCSAKPTVYLPPLAASLTNIIGEVGGQSSSALQRSGSSLLRKSYTSDDELEELDSPMNSIIVDKLSASSSPSGSTGKGGRKVVRYQLLREVWKDGQ
ncbi:unnamed protein product [Linum trigynum]|uniref:C2 NT-type domain-containing protein n=1 Tax=Linum trigynum TaxID=586398 RepID=A0AAV2CFY4_9ROSI